MWCTTERVLRQMFEWAGLQLPLNWRKSIPVCFVFPSFLIAVYLAVTYIRLKLVTTASSTEDKEKLDFLSFSQGRGHVTSGVS